MNTFLGKFNGVAVVFHGYKEGGGEIFSKHYSSKQEPLLAVLFSSGSTVSQGKDQLPVLAFVKFKHVETLESRPLNLAHPEYSRD